MFVCASSWKPVTLNLMVAVAVVMTLLLMMVVVEMMTMKEQLILNIFLYFTIWSDKLERECIYYHPDSVLGMLVGEITTCDKQK